MLIFILIVAIILANRERSGRFMINNERLKQERIRKGLSQEELGKLIHVSKVAICGYEKGTKNPTLENFEHLLEILELQPNDLLNYNVNIIKEDTIPYGSKITKSEQELILELRKNKKLYNTLCKNIDKLDKIEIK